MLKIIWSVSLLLFSMSPIHAEATNTDPLLKKNSSFEQYKEQLDLEDIYIAFVQPSLISPMSYFGHTFLVFKKHKTWEFSKTFSFSAVIPNHFSSKDLILNGASGKLSGRFVIGNFHEFKHAYLTKEQRGISLYKLVLTDEEQERLLYKSFQVYNDDFVYHFFEKNCSTELINYLSTIRPTLSKNLDTLTIKDPSSTLNLLIDEKLILKRNILYFPKIASSFKQYLHLDNSTRRQINNYLSSHDSSESLQQLSDTEKSVLANTSSILFNFLHTPPPLYSIFQNQIFSNDVPPFKPLKKNLAYTNPARVSFGMKDDNNGKSGSLSFMPSHLERFEERFSYVNEMTLKIFYTEVNFNDHQLTLDQFDLLELAAYNKSFSKINIPSWRFYTGYNDSYSPDKHSFMSEIGYGLSFGTANVLFSFMPQINIDFTNKAFTGQVNTLASYWLGTTNVSYHFVGNITGHKRKSNLHELKLNVPIKQNLSITFTNNISNSEFDIVFNKRFSF